MNKQGEFNMLLPKGSWVVVFPRFLYGPNKCTPIRQRVKCNMFNRLISYGGRGVKRCARNVVSLLYQAACLSLWVTKHPCNRCWLITGAAGWQQNQQYNYRRGEGVAPCACKKCSNKRGTRWSEEAPLHSKSQLELLMEKMQSKCFCCKSCQRKYAHSTTLNCTLKDWNIMAYNSWPKGCHQGVKYKWARNGLRLKEPFI